VSRFRPPAALLFSLPFLLSTTAGRAAVELAVDPSQSYIAVRVDKGGLLSFVGGHRHGVLAQDWTARICWDGSNPAASSARVTVRTSSLAIDTPEARAQAGLSESGPKAEDVSELQVKMLSPRFLSAETHPEIRFSTATVRLGGQNSLVLTGPLTIAGRTQTVSAPLRWERRADGMLLFTSELRVRQTQFGIQPESIAGLVRVQDEVEVRMRFLGGPTERACAAGP
jgi:polyisoprenoid-binding protein YceI